MSEKIVYLSHPLSQNTPLYAGKTGIELKRTSDLCNGDSSNSLWVSFPNHASTHVDAPLHFIPGGKSITEIPAAFWQFENVHLWRLSAQPGQLIEASVHVLDALPKETEILLIQTGFEAHRGEDLYWKRSPGLAPGLAAALRERCSGLRAIGVDCISISSLEHREAGRQAHREFLSREIVLIEDMKLSAVPGSLKKIIAAPVLIENADGAPITVFGFTER